MFLSNRFPRVSGRPLRSSSAVLRETQRSAVVDKATKSKPPPARWPWKFRWWKSKRSAAYHMAFVSSADAFPISRWMLFYGTATLTISP